MNRQPAMVEEAESPNNNMASLALERVSFQQRFDHQDWIHKNNRESSKLPTPFISKFNSISFTHVCSGTAKTCNDNNYICLCNIPLPFPAIQWEECDMCNSDASNCYDGAFSDAIDGNVPIMRRMMLASHEREQKTHFHPPCLRRSLECHKDLFLLDDGY